MQLTVQGEGRKESLENDKNASPVKDNDRPPDQEDTKSSP